MEEIDQSGVVLTKADIGSWFYSIEEAGPERTLVDSVTAGASPFVSVRSVLWAPIIFDKHPSFSEPAHAGMCTEQKIKQGCSAVTATSDVYDLRALFSLHDSELIVPLTRR